jgi:serine/threonine protein kinase
MGEPAPFRAPGRLMIITDTVLESRYRIDALIDRGGMADVYRARDLRLQREVAVKVLREVEHERRFAAEARTLANLQHPNLVRLLDAGTDNGDAFLVLELLGGATVRELLERGPLDAARVARVGSETAAALDYIHRRGIIHRDVKPSNLMLDEHGSVRLADFGIARLLGGTAITTTHQAIGTMAYIAPEQLEGGDIGPAADIYSLGLVLMECLSGRRVFDGPPAVAGAARLSRDPAVPVALPGSWPTLLGAMTARNPAARPTAAALRASLSSGGPATVTTAPVAPRATPAATGPPRRVDTTVGPPQPARTDVAPPSMRPTARPQPRRRRRRWPWVLGLMIWLPLAAVGAFTLMPDNSGTSPGTPARPSPTNATPVTAAPTTTVPETLPPDTLLPAPDKPGNDPAADLRRWLEELQKRLLGG